jgi:hypothetical protein
VPQLAGDRRLHDAEDDFAVFDQGEVDAELAIALDELARAIERIDQPQAIPAAAGVPGRVFRGFFRQHGNVGGERFQARDEDVVRGHVRGGQRARVGFALHFEGVLVHRQDGCGCVMREGDGAFAQCIVDFHAAVSWVCR